MRRLAGKLPAARVATDTESPLSSRIRGTKLRTSVPRVVSDRVLFASDQRCCVCLRRGDHIHHLDGKPSKHSFENLVLLCIEHHDEVTTRGSGLRRRLTPGTLRLYRRHHYARVRASRSIPGRVKNRDGIDVFALTLDALTVRDIRQIRSGIARASEGALGEILQKLSSLVDSAGYNGRMEILEASRDVIDRLKRVKRPGRLADGIRSQVEAVVPVRGIRSRFRGRVPKPERELLNAGEAVAFEMAYEGALYTRNLAVTNAGGELLWKILRYARINGLRTLVERTVDDFETAQAAARRAADLRAVELLLLYQEHGLKGDWHYPPLPTGFGEAIMDLSHPKRRGASTRKTKNAPG
jgi:hypothetical protein